MVTRLGQCLLWPLVVSRCRCCRCPGMFARHCCCCYAQSPLLRRRNFGPRSAQLSNIEPRPVVNTRRCHASQPVKLKRCVGGVLHSHPLMLSSYYLLNCPCVPWRVCGRRVPAAWCGAGSPRDQINPAALGPPRPRPAPQHYKGFLLPARHSTNIYLDAKSQRHLP